MEVDNEEAKQSELSEENKFLIEKIAELEDRMKEHDEIRMEHLKNKEILSDLYSKGLIDSKGNLKPHR
jgi:predicted transcriptional regulator YheO